MLATASLSTKLMRIGAALLLLALAAIGLALWVTWQLEGGAAAVNEAGRMRMQTLQVWSRVEPEVLLAHWSPRQSEGAPEPIAPESVSFGKPPGLRTMAG